MDANMSMQCYLIRTLEKTQKNLSDSLIYFFPTQTNTPNVLNVLENKNGFGVDNCKWIQKGEPNDRKRIDTVDIRPHRIV